jgi:hypothetical protein
LWLAVNEEASFTEVVGVANSRRVRAKAPKKKPAIPGVDDLGAWRWQQTEMSSNLAVKLGFAVGSVSASTQSRTLIAEFSRSATVEVEGAHAQYGVAARLVVGVTSFEAKGALTIPVLAAEAQLGRSQASVNLTVTGYVGDGLAELLPTDILTLNVDTYSSLTTSISNIVKLIGSDRENVRPELLWVEAEDEGPAKIEDELTRAVGAAYALSQIRDSETLDEALNAYEDKDDLIAQEAIRHVYADLLPNDDQEKAAEASERATRLLDDYVVKRRTWLSG